LWGLAPGVGRKKAVKTPKNKGATSDLSAPLQDCKLAHALSSRVPVKPAKTYQKSCLFYARI